MTPSRTLPAALTALAMAACYASTLAGMFDQWATDEDMGHGFAVPLVIAWILWRERARWRETPAHPSGWGLAVMGAGAAIHLLASIGGGLFAGAVALTVSAAGAVICLGGFAFLRVWSFPLLLSLFMLPKLNIVYNQATLPLQLLASRIAAAALSLASVNVVVEGNILEVAGRKVAVEQACDGMRYLLTLGFTAVVFAYVADRKPWMRVALLASVVPIGVLANALRVAASAAIPALAAGTPHVAAGVAFFAACLLALAAARRLFNRAYARLQA